MNEEFILHTYECISLVTKQMLAAARGGQWDTLVSLERECSALFAPLFTGDDSRPRSPEFQRRKAELIRSVLDDDAQIRVLVEPWLAQLSDLLCHSGKRRQLSQAYGSNR